MHRPGRAFLGQHLVPEGGSQRAWSGLMAEGKGKGERPARSSETNLPVPE